MKTLLILGLALATTVPSQAQLFSRDNLGSALVGGILGGVIGHNSGRKTAEGIGIGAGAGLLLGALSNDYKRQAGYEPGYTPEPTYYGGSQYRYSTTGAVLGGIAGGVIGHNNGRRTAEGVAIGAASGLVLGAVADSSLRQPTSYYATPVVAQPVRVVTYPYPHHHHARPVFVSSVLTTPVMSGMVVPVQPVAAAPAAPAQTIIINNYYGTTPMGGANAMFGR
ncbi:MAG: hypothetical protein RL514_4130 [Verrucomicrobiota bacterium]|jgi:outer membrane lipoprotein SlyB